MDLPSVKETLLDLSFINDWERKILFGVINRDMELNKESLSSLEIAIFDRNEDLTEISRNENKCFCCHAKYNTSFSKFLAPQCYQCDTFLCKFCTQHLEKHNVCNGCLREWVFNIQLSLATVFYSDNLGIPSPLYGSKLIKISLENKTAVNSREPKREEKHLKFFNFDENRSTVASTTKKDTIQRVKVPHIDDIDSGFIKIRGQKCEEVIDEVSSLYSESCYENEYAVTGYIKFGVWYRADEGILYIRIDEATKLAGNVDKRKINPYVNINLLPGRSKHTKRKTSIHRQVCSTHFNEILKIKISKEDLGKNILWLSVWNWKLNGRNSFLGEVCRPLSGMDLTNTKSKKIKLKNMEEKVDDEYTDNPYPNGKIYVAVKFEQLSRCRKRSKFILGTLFIRVNKAEGLLSTDVTGDTNPFVRCFLLPNTSMFGKKKSKVIKKELNPVWDEEYFYECVSIDDLYSKRALELTLWDSDRRGMNNFMGGVRLGPLMDLENNKAPEWMDSKEEEARHWEQMLARTGEWVESEHALRSSMASLRSIKKSQFAEEDAFEVDEELEDTEVEESSDESTKQEGIQSFFSEEEESEIDEELQDLENEGMSFSKFRRLTLNRRGRGDGYSISGEIEVGVDYNGKVLVVRIIKASDIAGVYHDGTESDPFVQICLLPDKESKKKTKTQKKTLNPIYNEAFKFPVSMDDLMDTTLWLTMWSHSIAWQDKFLGEICIPFDRETYTFSDDPDYQSPPITYDLQDYSNQRTLPKPSQMRRQTKMYRINTQVQMNDPEVLNSATDLLVSEEVNANTKEINGEAILSESKEDTEHLSPSDEKLSTPTSVQNDASTPEKMTPIPPGSTNLPSSVVLAKPDSMAETETDLQQLAEDKGMRHKSFSKFRGLTLNRRGRGDGYSISGEIEVGVDYNGKALVLRIIKASDIAGVYHYGTESDPFVQICLLPDKEAKKKTKTQKKTRNPIYNETFEFPVSMDDVMDTTLWLTMWSHSIAWQDKFLGEICIPFDRETYTFSDDPDYQSPPITYDLQDYSNQRTLPKPSQMRRQTKMYRINTQVQMNDPEVLNSATDLLVSEEVNANAKEINGEAILSESKEDTEHLSPSDEKLSTPTSVQNDASTPEKMTPIPPGSTNLPSSVVLAKPDSMAETETDLQQLAEDKGMRHKSFSKFRGLTLNRRGRGDGYSISGEIEVGVDYNGKALVLRIIKASDIAGVYHYGTESDPFVQICLLPDKESKKKTKTQKKTRNPIYNETFEFPVSMNDVMDTTLWLTMWSHSIAWQDKFLGEICIPFDRETYTFSDDPDYQSPPITYDLQDYSNQRTLPKPSQMRRQTKMYRINTQVQMNDPEVLNSATDLLVSEEVNANAKEINGEAILSESKEDTEHLSPSDEKLSTPTSVQNDASTPETMTPIPPGSTNLPSSVVLAKPDSEGETEADLQEDKGMEYKSFLKPPELTLNRRGKGDGYRISGGIEAGIHYNGKALVVRIIRACNIAGVNQNGTVSDPLVQLYLLPDKESKKKTKPQKKTLNPIYNETFEFPISWKDLMDTTLWLTMWSYSRAWQNIFLGEICIPFDRETSSISDDPDYQSPIISYILQDYSNQKTILQPLTRKNTTVYRIDTKLRKNDSEVLNSAPDLLVSEEMNPNAREIGAEATLGKTEEDMDRHLSPSDENLSTIPDSMAPIPLVSTIQPSSEVFVKPYSDTEAEADLQQLAEAKGMEYKSFLKPPELTLNRRGKGDGYRISGGIEAGIHYNGKALVVRIVRACNIAGVNQNGTVSDPLVQLYLLPDKESKKKTKPQKKTLNPIYNETFEFPISWKDLMDTTLWLTMWSYSRAWQNIFLGEICIPFDRETSSISDDPDYQSPIISYILQDYSNQKTILQPLTRKNTTVYRIDTKLRKNDSEVLNSAPDLLVSEEMNPNAREIGAEATLGKTEEDMDRHLSPSDENLSTIPDSMAPIPLVSTIQPSSEVFVKPYSDTEAEADLQQLAEAKGMEYKSFLKPPELTLNRRGKGDGYRISGGIEAGIHYNGKSLVVRIVRACNIAGVNQNGTVSDPLVQLYLLPDKESKKKTKPQKKTLNPIYNETFEFPISWKDLMDTTLWLTMWSHSRAWQNIFLGEICIPLDREISSIADDPDYQSPIISYILQDYSNQKTILQPLTRKNTTVYRIDTKLRKNDSEVLNSAPDLLVSEEMNRNARESSAEATLEKTEEDMDSHLSPSDEKLSTIPDSMAPIPIISTSKPSSEVFVKPHSDAEAEADLQQFAEAKRMEYKSFPKPPKLTLNRRGKGDGYLISGEIVVGVDYNGKALVVRIVKAGNIAGVNQSGTVSDPFVQLYLLPDKESKRKTKPQKKTLNPIYNETYKFPISLEDLMDTTLWLTIWSYSRTRQNKFLGEICIPFDQETYTFSDDPDHQSPPITYTLQDYSNQKTILQPLTRRNTTVYRIDTKLRKNDPEVLNSAPDLLVSEEMNPNVREHAAESTLGKTEEDTDRCLSPSDEKLSTIPDLMAPIPLISSNQPSSEVLVEPYSKAEGEADLQQLIEDKGLKSKSFLKPPELTLNRRGKGDDYSISGEIEVGVDYNGKALVVRIIKASDIAGVYHDGAHSDPFVQLYLLPDKESKRKTKTKKKTLTPIYNEAFKFPISMEDLMDTTLWLTVWSHSMARQNKFLGEICIPFDRETYTFSDDPDYQSPPITYDLQDYSNQKTILKPSLTRKNTTVYRIDTKIIKDPEVLNSAPHVLVSEEMIADAGVSNAGSTLSESMEDAPRDEKLCTSKKDASMPETLTSLSQDSTSQPSSDVLAKPESETKPMKSSQSGEEEERETEKDLQQLSKGKEMKYKSFHKPPELTLNRRGKGDAYSISGEIEVGVDYNGKALVVRIIKASDIAGVYHDGAHSDSFVQLYLLPDKESKRKTKMQKKTLNPIYNEAFKFPISMEDLMDTTLWLTVWSHSMARQNKFLGEICIPFDRETYTFSDDPDYQSPPITYDLQDYSNQKTILKPSLTRKNTTVYRIDTKIIKDPEVLNSAPHVLVSEEMIADAGVSNAESTLSESTEDAPRDEKLCTSKKDASMPETLTSLSQDSTQPSSDVLAKPESETKPMKSSQSGEEEEKETEKDLQQLTKGKEMKYKSFLKPPELTLNRRGKGDAYSISGEIEVGVDYNGKALIVRIIKASDIAGVYHDGAHSDSFVQLYLLPDKESKRKTKTQKKTLNPIYNEAFKFPISMEDLMDTTLWLTVWSHSMARQNKFLGEICIPFDRETYTFSDDPDYQSPPITYDLQDYSNQKTILKPSLTRKNTTVYRIDTKIIKDPEVLNSAPHVLVSEEMIADAGVSNAESTLSESMEDAPRDEKLCTSKKFASTPETLTPLSQDSTQPSSEVLAKPESETKPMKSSQNGEQQERETEKDLQQLSKGKEMKYKSFHKPPELTLNRRGKGDAYSISGEIEVGVDYNGKALVVRIIKASDIAGVYHDGAHSDSFVQLYLLPDKESKRKTKTQKKTLNPIYNEAFKFPISMEDLMDTTLWLTVWSHSMARQNKFLGEICIPFDRETYTFSDDSDYQSPPITYDLQDYSNQKTILKPSLTRKNTTVYRIDTKIIKDPEVLNSAPHVLVSEEMIADVGVSNAESTLSESMEGAPRDEKLCTSKKDASMPETLTSLSQDSTCQPSSEVVAKSEMKAMKSSQGGEEEEREAEKDLQQLTEKKEIKYKTAPKPPHLTLNRRGKGDGYIISGEIEVGVDYNGKALVVRIVTASDIAGVNQKGTQSDPFVKLYLLPDKESKKKTKTIKKTLNPIYNETFKFTILMEDLLDSTLWLTMWSYARARQNKFLGEICIPFDRGTHIFSDDPCYESAPVKYILQDYSNQSMMLEPSLTRKNTTKYRIETKDRRKSSALHADLLLSEESASGSDEEVSTDKYTARGESPDVKGRSTSILVNEFTTSTEIVTHSLSVPTISAYPPSPLHERPKDPDPGFANVELDVNESIYAEALI